METRLRIALAIPVRMDYTFYAASAMMAGSCAISRREPCQVLTEAAVSVRGMCCRGARFEHWRYFCGYISALIGGVILWNLI